MAISSRRLAACSGAIISLVLPWLPQNAAAQGQPTEIGSPIPIAIWFVGAAVLGIVIAYGIMRNRSRTKAEKQLTDRATKDLYAKEDREA